MKKLVLLASLLIALPALAETNLCPEKNDFGCVAVKFAAINVDGADSDEIIAAVTGKKLLVLGYVLTCSGAVVTTFEDGTDGDDFTGALVFGAAGSIVAPVSPLGYFKTDTITRGLKLLKSAGVNCDGHITYAEVD